MAQVEFIYNGVCTIILCNLNEKMKDIFQNKNIFYIYDGKVGINAELTFVEVANSEDKRRNKMNIIVFENEIEIQKENRIKSKNIIIYFINV